VANDALLRVRTTHALDRILGRESASGERPRIDCRVRQRAGKTPQLTAAVSRNRRTLNRYGFGVVRLPLMAADASHRTELLA
jgi:hypothetical protein